MSDLGEENPSERRSDKPPKRNWAAARKERFFDLKFSHFVEIILTGALVGIAYFQYTVYSRQAGIMETQATIAARQNEITIESSRAIVFAKDIRIEKKDGAIPGQPGKFEAYWWFAPVLENGGSTSTENMRVSAQAYVDPSRPEIFSKLPFGMALAPKQFGTVSRIPPEAGPGNPENLLIHSEELERQNKPSQLIRTILGPRASQAIAGFGVPIEETKRRVREGGRWFILGAIHYKDRFSKFSKAPTRLSKYCFSIGFEIVASGELEPTTSPCPHWNCADEECENDKSAYDAETAGWQPGAVFVIEPQPPSVPSAPSPAQPPAATPMNPK